MKHKWLKDRLRDIKVRQSDLADALGLAQPRISEIIKGERQVQIEEAVTIAKVARMPVEDVMARFGAKLDQPKPVRKAGMVNIAEMDVRSSAGGGAIVDFADELHNWGFPLSFVQEELRASADEIRIITNVGDSMLSEPRRGDDIEPGDKLVVCLSDRTPSPPGIFILHDGYGLVTKRLEIVPENDEPTVRIISNNPAYSTYERHAEEIHIVGRVIGKWMRY